jgi:hypothetical protein
MIKYWEDSSACKVLFFYLRKYDSTFSYGISKYAGPYSFVT